MFYRRLSPLHRRICSDITVEFEKLIDTEVIPLLTVFSLIISSTITFRVIRVLSHIWTGPKTASIFVVILETMNFFIVSIYCEHQYLL